MTNSAGVTAVERKTYKGAQLPDELAAIASMSIDAENVGLDSPGGAVIISLIGRKAIASWQSLAEKWITRTPASPHSGAVDTLARETTREIEALFATTHAGGIVQRRAKIQCAIIAAFTRALPAPSAPPPHSQASEVVEALEFYADPRNYCDLKPEVEEGVAIGPPISSIAYDGGTRARAALSRQAPQPADMPSGEWRTMNTKPESGRRIAALIDDGSGCEVLFIHDNGALNFNGEEDRLNDFNLWTYLPDDYRLWFERTAAAPTAQGKV